jgi:exonuclease III
MRSWGYRNSPTGINENFISEPSGAWEPADGSRTSELVKAEEADILFLSETKLIEKEMENFRWMLNMPNMIVIDCKGRSGGLALFWRNGVDVRLRWKGRYHIDVDVVEQNGTKWRFTGIYGESKQGLKENTWRLLRTLHGQSDLPCLCMGDFNEILSEHEKGGGLPRPPRMHGIV